MNLEMSLLKLTHQIDATSLRPATFFIVNRAKWREKRSVIVQACRIFKLFRMSRDCYRSKIARKLIANISLKHIGCLS